jgi:S-formylglutathione hydrolase FrmB
VTLREVEGVAGPPWEPERWGRFERHVVESEVLAGNPLGDPARRPLWVYLPEGYADDGDRVYPTIYLIQGMTGQIDMWLNRRAFEPNTIEHLDGVFSDSSTPPAIVVMVDAWTSVGGSQFINSAATGDYLDYLCDEVVGFIDSTYATAADRDHRGLTGKSSGGYGAMVVPMLRPDVFGALASHAGDALFEICYQPEFPQTVRALRDHFDGSYDRFWAAMHSLERFEFGKMGAPLNTYAMASCYSPDENDPPHVVLPFDIETGELDQDVWERWLAWDPVRMAPDKAEALDSMRLVYLDAGRGDEYYLDLGAAAFAKQLRALGVDHSLELFDGTHMNINYRYPKAIAALARALSD